MGLMSYLKEDRYGTVYVRLVVPKHLKKIIGKTELKKSLRTKDWREANMCGPHVLIQLKNQIEAAEKDASITIADINRIASLWKNNQLAQFEDEQIIDNYVRKEWIDDHDGQSAGYWAIVSNTDAFELCRDRSIEAQSLNNGSRFNYNLFKPQLGDALEQFMTNTGIADEAMTLSKLHLLKTSPNYLTLVKALSDVYAQVAEAALIYIRNNAYSQAHNLPPVKYQPPEPIIHHDVKLLSVLFEEYQQSISRLDDDKRKTTAEEYGVSVQRFIELHGDLDIKSINKRHIAEFKSKLEVFPSRPNKKVSSLPINQQIAHAQQHQLKLLSAGTVKKHIRGLSAVLTYAIDMGLLEQNPAAGIRFTSTRRVRTTADASKSFTPDEVNRIFRSGVFVNGEKPDIADYGEAHYWIPLILYYTGARVEEIAQLYVDDIQQRDDIWFIRVSEEHDEQSIKTDSSLREIPLHSHLIALGLIEYKLSLSSNGRLFPRLNRARNKYHTALAKWWSKYLKTTIGIVRPTIKPYHAFRHTFITLCRDNDIREDVQNAITGHSQSDFSTQNVGREYGHFPLSTKKESIDKIPALRIED